MFEEIRRLHKEVDYLKRQGEILKKAMNILSEGRRAQCYDRKTLGPISARPALRHVGSKPQLLLRSVRLDPVERKGECGFIGTVLKGESFERVF